MKCAASEELATSTAWMFEPYSWPMRWNTRSAPERSTRTATPGYLASNDLAIFSASGRSTEVYQTTLPSFFAASTSAGVTALAAGAADSTCVESAPPAASAPVPIIRSRREILNSFIAYPPGFLGWYFFCYWLPAQSPAAIRRQTEPDVGAGRDVIRRSCQHAQL